MQIIDQSLIVLQLFAADSKPPAGPLELLITYFPMVLIVVAAWFLLYRPERERMRKQRELLANVKKNDRVITASGIIGTVSSVDREQDRVVLKVDESSNAKITFTLASVNRVLTDSDNGNTTSAGA
ncbi:MAG: preprotein translocase subunit YajC [Pirellulales bacterium]|jgi:preprotein translocase subunit YajC